MTQPDLLDRLRHADPVREQPPGGSPELMNAILARPGDPRLGGPLPRRRWRRRLGLPLATLVVGVGTAWAATGASPLALFVSNPQHDSVSGSLWNQDVVPATVRRVTSVAIPSVGRVEFWFAETAQRGWCGALRLPGGGWVARDGGPLDGGGAAPGCQPTRETVNAAGEPVFVINGFDYAEGDVDARDEGHGFWRITYGVVEGRGRPVRVVDRVSGRSAPVLEGRLFALAIPDPDPSGMTELRLVALDAAGRVVAEEAPQG